MCETPMRQLQTGNNIANGIYPGNVSHQVFIYRDKTAINIYPDLFKSHVLGARTAPDGYQQQVGIKSIA